MHCGHAISQKLTLNSSYIERAKLLNSPWPGQEIFFLIFASLEQKITCKRLALKLANGEETMSSRIEKIDNKFKEELREMSENVNHNQRLTSWNQLFLTPAWLEQYAQAVHQMGCPIANCLGFIDSTVRPISQPEEHQRLAQG